MLAGPMVPQKKTIIYTSQHKNSVHYLFLHLSIYQQPPQSSSLKWSLLGYFINYFLPRSLISSNISAQCENQHCKDTHMYSRNNAHAIHTIQVNLGQLIVSLTLSLQSSLCALMLL